MEKTIRPIKIQFFTFFLRLIPAAIFLILLFYFIAPVFISGHLKLFKNQLRMSHPEYEIIGHDIIKINQLDYIQFYIKVNKTPTMPGTSLNKGAIVKVKGQASTLCIAPIIIFSLILAWPGLTLRRRIKSVLIAMPLTFFIAAIDFPIMFIADIESVFSDTPLLNSLRLLWKHLLNNGGRQFMGLLIAVLAIALAGLDLKKQEASPDKVGRNEACPCGSGKKYKHCCMA